MKKNIILLVLVLSLLISISNITAKAQIFESISIGPTIGFKFGKNYISPMKGRKEETKLSKLPELGISTFALLSEENNLGISLDVLYNTFSNRTKIEKNEQIYDFTYSYISLSPHLKFQNLLLGFTFAYPIKANFGNDIPNENIRVMSEFNLGYSLPIMIDDQSEFNIFIKAGLMLSPIYYDYPNNDPLKLISPAIEPDFQSEKFNPRILSFTLGLNYMLNIYPSMKGVSNPIGE